MYTGLIKAPLVATNADGIVTDTGGGDDDDCLYPSAGRYLGFGEIEAGDSILCYSFDQPAACCWYGATRPEPSGDLYSYEVPK